MYSRARNTNKLHKQISNNIRSDSENFFKEQLHPFNVNHDHKIEERILFILFQILKHILKKISLHYRSIIPSQRKIMLQNAKLNDHKNIIIYNITFYTSVYI